MGTQLLDVLLQPWGAWVKGGGVSTAHVWVYMVYTACVCVCVGGGFNSTQLLDVLLGMQVWGDSTWRNVG